MLKLVSGHVNVIGMNYEVTQDDHRGFIDHVKQLPLTLELLKEIERSSQDVKLLSVDKGMPHPGGVAQSNQGLLLILNPEAMAKVILDSGLDPALVDEVYDLNLASAIVHELVHYTQYQQGRIICTDDMFIEWEGKLWMPQASGEQYFNSPWETEAFIAQSKWMAAKISQDPEVIYDELRRQAYAIKNIMTGK